MNQTENNPRFFYGWLIVLIAFCGWFITAGTSGYIFGQFIKPLSLAFGWSVGFVSSMTTARSVATIFFTPFVGRLTDRFGSRPIMLIGALIAGSAWLFASTLEQPLVFYAVYALGISTGYSMLGGIPAQTAITHWFRRRRGMALALATSGISVGGIVMVPLAQYLLDQHGWRFTMGAIGIGVMLVMLPPVFLFMRDKPEQMGLQPDGESAPPHGAGAPEGAKASAGLDRVWTTREVLASPNFWKQALGYMFAFAMLQVTLVYQFPVVVSRGFDNATAAFIVSLYATSAALSRLGWGYLSDRRDVNKVAVSSIWIAGVGVLILVAANSLPTMWLYALIGGAGIGGMASLQSIVTAQSFGRRSFGTVSGLLNPMNMLASAIAVPFTGFMYDATGSYTVPLVVVVALAMLSCVSLLRLPRGER